jgi:hypothetical protein
MCWEVFILLMMWWSGQAAGCDLLGGGNLLDRLRNRPPSFFEFVSENNRARAHAGEPDTSPRTIAESVILTTSQR